MAWLSLVHCEMLNYACTAHFFLSLKLTSPMGDFEKKKKSLVPCLISLDQKPVIKFVWP